MDEGRFNLALQGFLKEVGVTSQREVEQVVRDQGRQSGEIKLVWCPPLRMSQPLIILSGTTIPFA
jgi:hypothetical protein